MASSLPAAGTLTTIVAFVPLTLWLTIPSAGLQPATAIGVDVVDHRAVLGDECGRHREF